MPQLFNACEYLLDRRLAAGDGPRTALTGAAGDVSYAALHDQVRRTVGVAADPRAAARAAGADADGRHPAVRGDVPGRDADGCDPGAGVHDAARRRRGRAAARLAGPVPGRDPGVRGYRGRGRGRRRPSWPRCWPTSQPAQPGPGPPAQRPGRGPARRHRVPDHRRLARVLALHLGHDRGGPRRPCTGTARSRWCARRTAPRCSASAPTTGACPRPRRSSPTAWATRCCSRCRSARPRSWSPARPGPA